MKYFMSIILVILILCITIEHHPIEKTKKRRIPSPSILETTLKEMPKYKENSESRKDVLKKKSPSIKPRIQRKEKESSYHIDSSFIQKKLFQYINQERTSLVTLFDPLLKSSTIRAKEAYTQWSHTRPNHTRWNTSLSSLIDTSSILHGENLAKIQIPYKNTYTDQDIDEVCYRIHQGLVNSPTHYAVMTNLNYKKVNIGLYIKRNNEMLVIIVAQHFIQ